MHEQVVGLVVKAPLAHHQPRPAVLAQLHHVSEVLLLLLAQPLVLLNSVDLNLPNTCVMVYMFVATSALRHTFVDTFVSWRCVIVLAHTCLSFTAKASSC